MSDEPKTSTIPIYTRFDREVAEQLRDLAMRDDRTVASVVRQAVDQYLRLRAAS